MNAEEQWEEQGLSKGDSIGDWVVVRIIAAGSQAVLYELVHSDTGVSRALKLLRDLRSESRHRLKTEGAAQSRLHHGNVVRVFGTVEIGRYSGLLLEYVNGPTLSQLVARARPDLGVALAVFHGILAAVHAAHRQGLIHRDIKPENVLMARDGGRWMPKLTDFGLVLDANEGSRITVSGAHMGSPRYMSPEQILNAKRVDHRSDLFSLGALLYELVVGRYAFTGRNQFATMGAVAECQYEPPRRVVPDLPNNVVETIERLLVADIEERLQSCEEIELLLFGEVSLLDDPFLIDEADDVWSEEVEAEVPALESGAGKAIAVGIGLGMGAAAAVLMWLW